VNSNLILEEVVNYKGELFPSSKEEEDNIIEEYTEALKSGEWKFSFRQYRENKTAGNMGIKPINQTRSGIQN
jgi:hypothetical protein